jgi:hypothetical protein
MNERIQELKAQARSYASRQSNEAEEWQWVYEEKFAQLIIRECAERAFDLAPSDESAWDMYLGIKEHFGVE